MTAQAVTKKVLNQQPLFILDVRNENDFNDWKIEGKNIEHLNVPYFDLIDGIEDEVLNKINRDKEILVVCAKQGSAEMVAEHLVAADLSQVYVLEGGMKSWSEHLEPIKVGQLKNGGSIYQFVRMGKGCLSYLIESGKEAMIVDSNRMIDKYVNFANEKGITIKHVVDTHLHADHISGGRMLREETGATYFLPPKDAEEVQFPYESLVEGKELSVGNVNIKVEPIYSPGHTIGSTSLIVDDEYLLTGDILFVESIGRPDLAGKAEDWVGDLRTTLYDKYKQLSEDLVVLPAHYSSVSEMDGTGAVRTTLGKMYAENTGLNITDEKEFRNTVSKNLPPQPNAYQEIRQTNMGKITPTKEEQQEMEIGPNRCAVHD